MHIQCYYEYSIRKPVIRYFQLYPNIKMKNKIMHTFCNVPCICKIVIKTLKKKNPRFIIENSAGKIALISIINVFNCNVTK